MPSEPTKRERLLEAACEVNRIQRRAFLLALDAALEELDPVEIGSSVPRERIKRLRAEVAGEGK